MGVAGSVLLWILLVALAAEFLFREKLFEFSENRVREEVGKAGANEVLQAVFNCSISGETVDGFGDAETELATKEFGQILKKCSIHGYVFRIRNFLNREERDVNSAAQSVQKSLTQFSNGIPNWGIKLFQFVLAIAAITLIAFFLPDFVNNITLIVTCAAVVTACFLILGSIYAAVSSSLIFGEHKFHPIASFALFIVFGWGMAWVTLAIINWGAAHSIAETMNSLRDNLPPAASNSLQAEDSDDKYCIPYFENGVGSLDEFLKIKCKLADKKHPQELQRMSKRFSTLIPAETKFKLIHDWLEDELNYGLSDELKKENGIVDSLKSNLQKTYLGWIDERQQKAPVIDPDTILTDFKKSERGASATKATVENKLQQIQRKVDEANLGTAETIFKGFQEDLLVKFNDENSAIPLLDRKLIRLISLPNLTVASEQSRIEKLFGTSGFANKKEGKLAKTYFGEFYRQLKSQIPFQVIRWCNGWVQGLTFMAFWLCSFLLLRDYFEHRKLENTWEDDLLKLSVENERLVEDGVTRLRQDKTVYKAGEKKGELNEVGRPISRHYFPANIIREFIQENPSENERVAFASGYHRLLDPREERLATRFSVRAMKSVCQVYAGSSGKTGEIEGAYDKATTFAVLDSARQSWVSRIENGKSMITYFAWAIPSIGFLGTVLGMGVALGKAGGMLSDSQDKQQEVINAVTADLGSAFDTTLIAIAVSLVLMVFIYLVRQFQEDLVYKIEDEIRDSIIPRFRPPSNAVTTAEDKKKEESDDK
jgi:biopolymer transport protein ExbB/TolQ